MLTSCRKRYRELSSGRAQSGGRSTNQRRGRECDRRKAMRILMLISAAALLAANTGTKVLAIGLVGFLALAIVAPQPAVAQFHLLGGITSLFNLVNQVANDILSFINNTMRPLLQGIQSAAQALQGFLNQLRTLWEQIVWPISEINRAKALAQQLIGTF